MKQIPKKALAVVIVVTIAFVATVFGMTGVIPVAFAVLLACFGAASFSAASVASLVAVFALYRDWLETALFALCVITALAVVIMLRKRVPYRVVVAVAAVMLSVGFYEYLTLPYTMAGVNPFDAIRSELTLVLGGDISDRMWFTDGVICAYTVLVGVFYGGICVVLTKRIADIIGKRLQDYKPFKPMAPFSLWYLSKSFTIGMITVVLSVLLFGILEVKNFERIACVAAAVIGLPLVLQGATFSAFMLSNGCFSGAARFWLVIAVVFALPYLMILLLTVGIFDQFTRLRSRIRIVPK